MLYFVFGCGGVFRIGHQSCVGGEGGGRRRGINGATFLYSMLNTAADQKLLSI